MRMIDIEQILLTRSRRRLPRWAVALLRHLLHEQRLNQILHSGSNLQPHDFLRHVFRELDLSARITLRTPIDPHGRYIFVSNHPFGALDGMLLAEFLLRQWSDVGVVVNDLLLHIEPLQPLWIPVNKYGRQSPMQSRLYGDALASPTKQILTFPAGICSRWSAGRVEDLEWRDRFVRDAERYGRQIIPIHIAGSLSARFYRLYRLRRALGIDFNVELLLLCDELFRQQGECVVIDVGSAIDPASLSGTACHKCRYIREQVYAMG